MRALIVDDEPVARRVLREEIEEFAGVEVVGEADNGETALVLISSLQPDLVFLDLQMPVLGGFEMLARLRGGRLPVIAIVTAYDQHAIRAFEAGAIDYLLKPVSQARLAGTIQRAQWLMGNPLRIAESVAQLQELAPQPAAGSNPLRKIVGKIGEEYFVLSLNEVLAFQAEGELIWIITMKQRYLATQNLKTIEERLRNTSFRRIHRNALVNVNQIRKMSVLTSQRWLVTLNNAQEFIVSKRQAKIVREVLSW
jgi:two-component system, LytTR family, response regulator